MPEIADVVETLRTNVEAKQFVDVGSGASDLLGVSQAKLRNALFYLKNEGYEVYMVLAEHEEVEHRRTAVKVLAAPGTHYQDVNENKDMIKKVDA